MYNLHINLGRYSSMVEHLYVAQYVPCSNQGIHPEKKSLFILFLYGIL